MAKYKPTENELLSRLEWFVHLRWLFLLVLAVMVFCATHYFRLHLLLIPIILIAGVVLVYNCIFLFLHKIVWATRKPSPSNIRIEANLQIGLDLLVLALLIHFSGGIENPFFFFFVFHMIVGSLFLLGRDSWYQAVIAIGIPGLLTILSWNRIISYHHIEGFGSLELWNNLPYLLAFMVSFVATILLTVYMTSSISRSLHKRGQALYLLAEQLERKNEELENANDELRWQQNLLIQSEKLASLGKLSAGIAHELNTPLTGILSFSHFIKEATPKDKQIQNDIDIVIRETERCKKVIKGLLDFARQSRPEKKSNSIVNVLNRTINLVVHHKDFQNIELLRNFPDNLPDIVFDEDQLQQVFMNLIVNAMEALPAGGQIKIRVVQNQAIGTVDIIFADNGPGISPENQKKIFDPFFTTKDMGNGLGLSVSFGIIENHGGKLTVHCPKEGGTVFTVRLPIGAKPESHDN